MMQNGSKHPVPHPSNSLGDFYVEKGCCISCGFAESLAPTVIRYIEEPENLHCVVAKQPETPAEVDQTLEAMFGAEADCIRYRGTNMQIIQRILKNGSLSLCDLPAPIKPASLVRSHVTFAVTRRILSPNARFLAKSLIHFLNPSDSSFRTGRTADTILLTRKQATIHTSWFKQAHHRIDLEQQESGIWLATTKPHPDLMGAWQGLSRTVARWLEADQRFTILHWYTDEEWKSGNPGHPTAI